MISVIIPTLNERSTIGKTLRQLAKLEGEREVIVVDNGSSDGTPSVAAMWALTLTGPPGRGPAMNVGAARARGDVLLFLHADTLLPPGALMAVDAAVDDPRVVGGCFRVTFEGADWRSRLVGVMYSAFGRFGLFYGDAAIFVRRAAFEAMGGYKPLPLMEDFDLCLRLRRTGRTVRLPLFIVTSDRRWRKQGFLKTVLVYLAIQGLYLLGIRHPGLFRLYKPIR